MTDMATPSGFLQWMDSSSTLWREKDKLGLKKASIDVLKPVLRLLHSKEEENLKNFVSACLDFNPRPGEGYGGCMICEYGISAVESLSSLPDEPPKVRALIWVVEMAVRADNDDTGVSVIGPLSETAEKLDNPAWKALTWFFCADQCLNGWFGEKERQEAWVFLQAVDDWLEDNEFPELSIKSQEKREFLRSTTY